MKTTILLFTILCLLTSLQVVAQDANFSQFYHAPTIFNPAEIGHRTSGGKYRLNGVHRNLGEGFKTTNIAVDNTLDWEEKSYMGVGLAFIKDETLSGGFQTMTFLIGSSFHISLNKKENHFLSIGSQFGFVNNRVKIEKLRFENDILGGESEAFVNTNLYNLDSRFGLLYSFFSDKKTYFKIGVGANHVITFTDKFITDISRTDIQITGYIDFTKRFRNEKWLMNPHLLFINQGNFNQTSVGCVFTRTTKSENGFSFGGNYKTTNLTSFKTINSKDAVVAILGLNFKNGSRIYVSYDVNISPLNNTNNISGNVEFGFQYIHNSTKNKRKVSPNILRNQGN